VGAEARAAALAAVVFDLVAMVVGVRGSVFPARAGTEEPLVYIILVRKVVGADAWLAGAGPLLHTVSVLVNPGGSV